MGVVLRKKEIQGLLLASVVLGAMGLGGCQSRQTVTEGSKATEAKIEKTEDTSIVVGFSQVGSESDWRVANTESMRNTFSEENGYELLFSDAKQKQENQIAAIRNYILQGVDYIVVAPGIEDGWDEVLQEAKDAGIPVIVVDRMVNTEDEDLFTAWVGSDTYWEGELAVDWLAEYLEEQGRADDTISILHVQGTLGSTPQYGRTAGLEEGIRSHANWKLLASVEGEFIQPKAYEEVSRVLAQEPEVDVDVIYCENDNSAFGAIQALEEAGISYGTEGDVIVISFDATRAGLTACLNGQINLDVECNPLHGPRVESIIQQIENGETPDKYTYVEETYFVPEKLSEELIAERVY